MIRVPHALFLAALAILAAAGPGARAQTAISSITTSLTVNRSSSTTLNSGSVTFANADLAINTMTDANGTVYTVTGSASAAFLRTDSTSSGELNQSSAWYLGNAAAASNSSPTTLYGTYNSSNVGNLLLGNNLLAGADNVFINSSGTAAAQGNVERLDLIFNGSTGITANSNLALAVFDRGTGDSFSIAVVTGVDANGNPTSYGGNLLNVSNTAWTNAGLLNSSNTPSAVLNSSGSPTDYLLRYDSSSSTGATHNTEDDEHNDQNINGLTFTMAQLGITSGTTIYGYSLMAGDVTDGGNINNLVNYRNTKYFPTSTTDSNAFNGLDPVAVNGVIFSMHPVPEPATYAEIFFGAALFYAWRRYRSGCVVTTVDPLG